MISAEVASGRDRSSVADDDMDSFGIYLNERKMKMKIVKIGDCFAVCLGSDARKETAPKPSMLLYQSMTKLPWIGSNSLDHDRADDSMIQLQIRLSIQEPISSDRTIPETAAGVPDAPDAA